MPETVEPHIEQHKPAAAVTKFQKCVKFRVHFPEQVTVLNCHGMGLQLVGANGFNPPLVQNDGNVLLGAWNLQAQGIRQAEQTL